MAKADILVSVVAVLRGPPTDLPVFVEDVTTIVDEHYSYYEILLIDNGSDHETCTIVRHLLGKHPCVRYLRLTRPVDVETAILAGLDAAIGDYVVTLSPDSDPPAELVPMVEACRTGSDLVIGVIRQPARPGLAYWALRGLFLALSRWIVKLDVLTGTTGFRVQSRHAVNALVKVRLRRRYFALVAADIGLTTCVHPYDRKPRSDGRTVRSLYRAVRIGLSVLVHNSITPLRVASGFGLMGSLLSLLYSLYVVGVYLFKADVMPGWTTLSLAMSGLFGLAFLMLALMGEYLGRLLEESSDQPLYHVRDELSSAVMLTDMSRRNVLGRFEELPSIHPTDQAP